MLFLFLLGIFDAFIFFISLLLDDDSGKVGGRDPQNVQHRQRLYPRGGGAGP